MTIEYILKSSVGDSMKNKTKCDAIGIFPSSVVRMGKMTEIHSQTTRKVSCFWALATLHCNEATYMPQTLSYIVIKDNGWWVDSKMPTRHHNGRVLKDSNPAHSCI